MSQRVYITNFNAVATPTAPPMMKYLNAKQLEALTTINHRTWLLYAKEGRVPSYKIGSRVLFREREIQEFIEDEKGRGRRPCEPKGPREKKEEKERRDKEGGVTAKRHPKK